MLTLRLTSYIYRSMVVSFIYVSVHKPVSYYHSTGSIRKGFHFRWQVPKWLYSEFWKAWEKSKNGGRQAMQHGYLHYGSLWGSLTWSGSQAYIINPGGNFVPCNVKTLEDGLNYKFKQNYYLYNRKLSIVYLPIIVTASSSLMCFFLYEIIVVLVNRGIKLTNAVKAS